MIMFSLFQKYKQSFIFTLSKKLKLKQINVTLIKQNIINLTLNMKILLFCFFVYLINATVFTPNCAFYFNKQCISCLHGIELRQGKCLNCMPGFVLIDSICVEQVKKSQKINNKISDHFDAQTFRNAEIDQISQDFINKDAILIQQKSQGLQNRQKKSLETQNIIQKKQNKNKNETKHLSLNQRILTTQTKDLNCKTITIDGICSECLKGFYFNLQIRRCIHVNPLCLTWNSQGNCLSCYPEYVLKNLQCFIRSKSPLKNLPSSNSYQTNANQRQIIIVGSELDEKNTIKNYDPKCIEYHQNGTCKSCFKSFYYDAKDTKRCVAVNPLCKRWNKDGSCFSCYIGYILSANSCIQSLNYSKDFSIKESSLNILDPNCNTFVQQVCIKCVPRTYLNQQTKKCTPIDSKCKLWNQFGVCTACYEGYFVYNQKECKIFSQLNAVQNKSSLKIDTNCLKFGSKGTCTQCIWRFTYNQKTQLCQSVSDLCQTWNQVNGFCTSCFAGYSLSQSGQCKLK